MTLVSTALHAVPPARVERIAASLGLNADQVGAATRAILPALFAVFARHAATADGAKALAAAIDRQDPDLLQNLSSLLGGPGQIAALNNGASILASLLDASAPVALTDAVAHFTKLKTADATPLVQLMAPVAIGALAASQRAAGLDAAGLARLLADAKREIAAAVPAGFAPLLSATGLVDLPALAHAAPTMLSQGGAKPAPATPAATSPAGDRPTAPSPRAASPRPTEPVAASGRSPAPSFNWQPWLGTALALLTAYAILVAVTPSPPSSIAPPAVTPAKVNSVEETKAALTTLAATLANIKDQPTAQAAVPHLNAVSLALSQVAKSAVTLAPADRSRLASAIAVATTGLQTEIARVLAVPGAAPLVKPMLDAIANSLAALGRA